MASAHAMQNSAASLSYAAIADHLSGVYRKRIENYWLKFQSARMSSDDGAFGLCEQILILSDYLVEDVKFVRRYKPQFRSIIHQVIKVGSNSLCSIALYYVSESKVDCAGAKCIGWWC